MNEPPIIKGRKPQPDDLALRDWFAEQRFKNIETLDGAALQLVALCTTLLGVLLGILSLVDIPTYLQQPVVKVLGSAAAVAFMFALGCALFAFLPHAYAYQPNSPSEQARVFEQMQQHKSCWLRWAALCFALGMGCLTVLMLWVLWTAAPAIAPTTTPTVTPIVTPTP